MTKNQQGFSLVLPLLVLFVAIISVSWLVYERQKTNRQTQQYLQAHSRTGPYQFQPVSVDVSKNQFTPFQGFSLFYPDHWVGQSEDNFTFQPSNGQIGNIEYISKLTTNLYSPDFMKWGDTSKELATQIKNIDPLAPVKKGAHVSITAVFDFKHPRSKPTSDCSQQKKYYSRRHVKALNFSSFTACEVVLNDNQYAYFTGSAKAEYFTELLFNSNALPEQKDYYISAARAIVGSFQLY